MKHEDMIVVIKAHKEGRPIQYRSKNLKMNWTECNPVWDFHNSDYRVAPMNIPDNVGLYELTFSNREVEPVFLTDDTEKNEYRFCRTGMLSSDWTRVVKVKLIKGY